MENGTESGGHDDAPVAEPTYFGTEDDKKVLRYSWSCRQESYTAKRDRMWLNRLNYDAYNLKGDFSHKKKGQSKEFLPKVMMATEQMSSFMHQAMVNTSKWFRIESEDGVKNPKITPGEMTLLTARQLDKVKYPTLVEDALKMGLLGSLMIAKVHGEWVDKPRFYTREVLDEASKKTRKELWRDVKQVWQLKIDLVRQEDWYPDPTGEGLYEMQQIEMDLHKIRELSEGPNAIYDKEIVDSIVGGFEDVEQVGRKARETAQNQTFQTIRKRVRVWEFYGNILDTTTGHLLHKNVTWTIANDRYLIRKPTPYPFWHGQSPFVVSPIIRLPKSVWHKAMMDGPTALNGAINELFNLQLDSGIMATWGIRQLRTGWLADETKYAEGIAPGETLEVNDQCPPGQKVLEPVQTAVMSPETTTTMQAVQAEFNMAALTNETRMGAMSQRAVKATEVVEASQSITSTFTGLSEVIEQDFNVEILKKAWPTIAQHMNDLDTDEVKALITEKRALEIAAMSNEEIFVATAQGFKFKAFGISKILSKMKDFKKLTALLQTIGSSEVLIEEFIKKYSFTKFLTELLEALDIDVEKISLEKEEIAAMQAQQQQPMGPGAAQPGSQPNVQSQIPQVGSNTDKQEGGFHQPMSGQGAIPQAKFPPSRALQVQGK